MGARSELGELLIAALEEAVAYKRGKLPELHVNKYEVPSREDSASPLPSRRKNIGVT